jgi:adenylate cyclase
MPLMLAEQGRRPDGVLRDLDVVRELVGHRLRQEDIRRVLDTLNSEHRDAFTNKLADILHKTSALLEVSRRVSDSLSLDVLLPRMVEIVSEFLQAERTTLFLYDRRTGDLYSRVAQGDLTQEIRFPSSVGIAGAVFTNAQAEVIPDAYADPRFNKEIDKKTGFRTRNILCAPIRRHDNTCIGVAQVLNKKDGDFDQYDLHLLESVTSQAAAAFVNAQLHEEIDQARREEQKLLEITNAISRELQLEPLLQKIMHAVTDILDADRATLFMFNAKTKELWSQVTMGGLTQQIRFPSHLGIAGSVFTSGQTINIPDAYADPRFNKEVDKKTGYKTDTILCMPVINKKGTTIGVVQVLNKRGRAFGPLDEMRLGAFSSQASIAIENAQLFEEIVAMKNYNESILESMSNGVITLSAEGRIVTANRAALRLLRKESDTASLLARPVGEVFFGKNAWLAESAERVRQSGKPDVAVDTEVWLRQEGDEPLPPGADRRREAASVNLQTVPLTDAKGASMGCMVMLEDITNEKRLKSTMARYMSKEVADKLLEEGESALGGMMQHATVLFTDIRSFTTISEKLGPQETVRMLNDYFSIMVDIILSNGGILDKYIGDAIMAVFGAPFSTPEDADNAVRTATLMLRALRELNRVRVERGENPIAMGIGINTDDVLSGNIGSPKRMDYTVIGDGVNLASRLEGANKPYGTEVLVSELTVRALKGAYRKREIDLLRVKGKNEPVSIYEILEHHDNESFPHMDEVLHHYHNGLACYRDRKFDLAEQCFHDALLLHPKDGASLHYRERCQYFLSHPPAADWDGVWTMKEK